MMSKRRGETGAGVVFAGYSKPNYTQVPDELFDEHLPFLSGAELKVLLYIMRRTFGFKKDSDDISFTQICDGIETRDGRVLDRGTGLSRSTAQIAMKGLVQKNLIIATRRTSPDRGNEPTSYSLNLVAVPYAENRHRGVPKTGTALYRKSATQETVGQEREKQHNVGGVSRTRKQKIDQPATTAELVLPGPALPLAGVAQLLHAAGISPDVANQLAATYPEDHILHEYDYTRWLLEVHPKRVRDNPAGFLRRAIERSFSPPPDYQTPAQREAAAAARAQAEDDDRRRFAAEQQEHARAKELTEQQLAEAYPAQPIAGTAFTTEDAWAQALALLRDQVTGPNFTMWLKPARLVRCDGGEAVIVAPFAYHTEHLSQRLDPYVTQALRTVLGTPVRCRYITLGEAVQPEAAHPTGEDATETRRPERGGTYAAG